MGVQEICDEKMGRGNRRSDKPGSVESFGEGPVARGIQEVKIPALSQRTRQGRGTLGSGRRERVGQSLTPLEAPNLLAELKKGI